MSVKSQESFADDAWSGGQSGFSSAARQLHKSKTASGKRKALLPGSKLRPLYKNYTNPDEGTLSQKYKVLPDIQGPISDQDVVIRQVTSGNLDYLPEFSPSTVRVYLASNYEDMVEERKAIMMNAVPRLQDYSASFGLKFRLVDMKFGVNKETLESDADFDQICTQEILSCKRLSLGCNFVVLIGNRYGGRRLRRELISEDYQLLLDVAKNNHMQNLNLLEECYRQDENSIPPVYRLQKMDRAEIMTDLGQLLSEIINVAQTEQLWPDEKADTFLISSLHKDIEQGVLSVKDPRNCCLCFHRDFQNYNLFESSAASSEYFDVIRRDDKNALKKEDLKAVSDLAETVKQVLGPENVKSYFIEWTKDGCSSTDEKFTLYLSSLVEDFVQGVKSHIDAQLHRITKPGGQLARSVVQECTHHLKLCKEKLQFFQGNAQVLFKVEKYLHDPRQYSRPFIIYGNSGSGKSSVMAKLSEEIHRWFGSQAVVVYRMLGTSTDSHGIYNVVVSVVQQICLTYKMTLPDPNTSFNTLYNALTTLREVLTVASKEHAHTRPLFILLDGIHRLYPHEESMRALWAITNLPYNVRVVLTTTEDVNSFNLLPALTQLLTKPEFTIEVRRLTQTDVEYVLLSRMEAIHRSWQENQKEKIMETFSKSADGSLHLSVLLQEASQWCSYTRTIDLMLSPNIEAAFNKVLDHLEDLFGAQLLMTIVGYITAMPIGIQEEELAELITADPDPEEDMRAFPLARVKDMLVLPPYILSKIVYSLGIFVQENMAYGTKVLAWSHGEFYKLAAKRYQVIYAGIEPGLLSEDATSYTLVLHENIVNLITKQTNTSTEGTSVKTLISPQYVTSSNPVVLNRLLVHLRVLLPLEGVERIKAVTLFNFKWLLNKLCRGTVYQCLQDIDSILQLTQHIVALESDEVKRSDLEELIILYRFIKLAQTALIKNREYLAGEVLGRLKDFTELSSVVKLVQEAEAYVSEEHQHTWLLPLSTCFIKPDQPLVDVLQGPTHILGFLHDGQTMIGFSTAHGVEVRRKGELIHRYPVHQEQAPEMVVPGRVAEFVVITHYSPLTRGTDITVVSTETGVPLLTSHFPQKFGAVALSPNDSILMVSTEVDLGNGTPQHQKCILGVEARTKEIRYTLPLDNVHVKGVSKLMFIEEIILGYEALVSFGAGTSHDFVLWNLDEEEMVSHIDLGCHMECFSVSGQIILCGSPMTGVLAAINLIEGQLICKVEHQSLLWMTDVLIDKTGTYGIVATRTLGVILYKLSTQVLKPKSVTIKSNLYPVTALALDDTQQFLIMGCSNGYVSVYSLLANTEVCGFTEHTAAIQSLIVDSKNNVYAAALNNRATQWHITKVLSEYTEALPHGVASLAEQHTLFEGADVVEPVKTVEVECLMEEQVLSVVAVKDMFITGAMTGRVKIWHFDTGDLASVLEDPKPDGGVEHLALASDDNVLVAHCLDPVITNTYRLKVWNMSTGAKLVLEDNSIVFGSTVLPKPHSDKLLVVSPVNGINESGLIFKVIDLFDLKCVQLLACNMTGPMNSTNLKFIGTSSIPKYSQRMKTSAPLINSKKYKQVDCEESTETVLHACLGYFPDKSLSFFFSVTVDPTNEFKVTLSSTQPLQLDSSSPACSVMLPFSRCVTGLTDGGLCQWDLIQLKTLSMYCHDEESLGQKVTSRKSSYHRAHRAAIVAVAMSSDSATLVSCCTNGYIKVWDTERRFLQSLYLVQQFGGIYTVSLSRDNKYITVGFDDSTLAVVHNNKHMDVISSIYLHNTIKRAFLSGDNKRLLVQVNQSNTCDSLIVLKVLHGH